MLTKAIGYIILSRLEQRAGDRKKAAATLQAGVDKTEPKSAPVMWELGRLKLDMNDMAGAEQIVEDLKKVSTSGQFAPLIEMLQAQIDYAKGQWKQAAQVSSSLFPE